MGCCVDMSYPRNGCFGGHRTNDAGRSRRTLLEFDADTSGFILKLLESMLLHKCQQPLDFHKINAADVTCSAKNLLQFFCHLELKKISRRRREVVIPLSRDDYVVLDADAAHALKVNARFHSYYHSLEQGRLFAFSKPRHFVNLQAQTMPCAVCEMPIERNRAQGGSRGFVDVRCSGPRSDCLLGCLLSLKHRVIEALDLGRRTPHVYCASHIATVAADYSTLV